MSSAIEDLKRLKTRVKAINGTSRFRSIEEIETKNQLKSINEAIVALEKKENYVIDFIRLEVLPKSKKEQFRVFFKDGTEQVFQMERVGEQK